MTVRGAHSEDKWLGVYRARNPESREASFSPFCPQTVRSLRAKEGQVTVTDFALRRCDLCHSCQPFWLEKVSSLDMGGNVTS